MLWNGTASRVELLMQACFTQHLNMSTEVMAIIDLNSITIDCYKDIFHKCLLEVRDRTSVISSRHFYHPSLQYWDLDVILLIFSVFL